MRRLLLLLLLFSSPPASSQEKLGLPPTLRSLLNEATRAFTSYELLTEFVTLAPHRLSGTEGNKLAVQWLANTAADMGLDEVTIEEVAVPWWDRGQLASLAVEGLEQPLTILALGGSVGTPKKGVTGPLLVVQDFDELDPLGAAIEGAIVVFAGAMDPAATEPFHAYGEAVRWRYDAASAAAARGAAAVLVRSVTMRRDDVPHTGAMGYTKGQPKIPAASLGWLSTQRLLTHLEKQPGAQATLILDCKTRRDAMSANVLAQLTGSSRPEEQIILACHLDSWDQGQNAHDDASGCVHILEALRLLKATGQQPQRSIRAVFYTNEENGGAGARSYVKHHKDELGQVVLAIESDRGGFAPRGFSTPAGPEWESILAQVTSSLTPLGVDRVQAGYSGADIGPLMNDGVPTAGLVVDPNRYFDVHHSANDVLEAVNPRELALGAVTLAWTALSIANWEKDLPRAPLPEEPKEDEEGSSPQPQPK